MRRENGTSVSRSACLKPAETCSSKQQVVKCRLAVCVVVHVVQVVKCRLAVCLALK